MPNHNALRDFKFRAVSAVRFYPDPIISLQLMKHNNEFSTSIHDIGLDKFFVHLTHETLVHCVLCSTNFSLLPSKSVVENE